MKSALIWRPASTNPLRVPPIRHCAAERGSAFISAGAPARVEVSSSWGIRSILQNCSYSEQLVWVSVRGGGTCCSSRSPPAAQNTGEAKTSCYSASRNSATKTVPLNRRMGIVSKFSMERYVLDLFTALLSSPRGGMIALATATSWRMSESVSENLNGY